MTVTINGTTGIVTPDIGIDGTTFVVDSVNDRIGIGTDNPASLLHLQGSAPRITFTDTAGTDDIGKIFSSSGALYLQQRDGSAHGEIIFRTENNSTAAERLRITNTGNVQIANGNLVFSTSGKGIDFSATSDGSGTTTSEIFDDYEEGSWTPTLTNGYTYTTLTARYTKIGNVVYIYCNFYRNDSGTYTSDLEVTNLPFDMGSYTNSMGLGVADSYNGTSDRRHGHINSNNSNSVKVIKDGTTAFVSYDNFVVNSRNLTMKWWYYTA